MSLAAVHHVKAKMEMGMAMDFEAKAIRKAKNKDLKRNLQAIHREYQKMLDGMVEVNEEETSSAGQP